MGLIDLVVLFGVGVILPLALGGRAWWWVGAAASVAVSFALPRGLLAAALVVPFGAAVVAAAASILGPGRVRRPARAEVLAGGYALVAAGALAQSRAGLTFAGIREPIVELTAVHFTYAGAAALTLAARARGRASLALVAAAPPVVALGFVTRHPVPQVGGAVMMALGVCG